MLYLDVINKIGQRKRKVKPTCRKSANASWKVFPSSPWTGFSSAKPVVNNFLLLCYHILTITGFWHTIPCIM